MQTSLTVNLDAISVPRTKLPDDLLLGDELGRGTNNRVYRASWRGTKCVLRVPRRGSDTQQRGSAIWELRHTLRASELDVGPKVLYAWYARHATEEWPKGLYLVMERFDDDLETVLCEDVDSEKLTELQPVLQMELLRCVETLAKDRIFVYDLKPNNIVVRRTEEGEVQLRIIDFGRDFCEWPGNGTDPDRNTPHIDLIQRLASDDERTVHILFATMMVVLSSTTTQCLYDTRETHRMDRETRRRVNPILQKTIELLDGMQGRNVHIVREVLRMDEVRGVLRHYHGRRYSGTHATMQFARGEETI